MGRKCIGVDVGGTSVKIGIFTVEGELVCKWEVPTRTEDAGAHILQDVGTSILEVMKEQGIDKADMAGVGLAVPGPVMPDGFVEVCVNLGWRNTYPARELGQILGIHNVCIGNDANVAALGEMWQGGGKGYEDVMMVTLGTGVGGGVIIGGKIIAGAHGLGGEIGHFHVREQETEACNCGGRGCLEQVASATGIAREARRVMASSEKPSALRAFGDKVTAKDVYDCAKAGDPLADGVVEVVSRYLGVALSHLALTVDPQVFVIGGGVSKAGTFLIDRIDKYYKYYTAISENRGKIVLATLGNDAGIYGAARLVLG